MGKFFQNGTLVFEVVEKEGDVILRSIRFDEDIRKIFSEEVIYGIDFVEVTEELLGFEEV